MAVVTSSQAPEGLRTYEHEPHEAFAEPSSSRFTAVNGRGSPATMTRTKLSNGVETQNIGIIEPNPREAQQNNPNDRPASPGPSSQNGQDQRPTTVANEQYRNDHSRTPEGQRSATMHMDSHKRKRSGSEEIENHRNLAYHGHSFPPGAHNRPISNAEVNGMRMSPGEQIHRRSTGYPEPDEARATPPEPYAHTTSQAPRNYEPEHGRSQPLSSEYDPHAQPNQQEQPYYGHHQDPAEARLAQALQRENYNHTQAPIRDHFGSPDDDVHRQQQYGEYGTNRSSISGPDGDRKRRKRVFSNRTKTGCMTCRKRKKKCDETHPECNNCLRGGFVCEGYTTRNTWQKPTPAKAPVPLQSKTGYADSPHREQHGQSTYTNEISPDYVPRPITTHAPIPASDGDRIQPIVLDEERELPRPVGSPTVAHGKASWAKVPRPYPSHPPHLSKYQPEIDRRSASSAHEVSHDDSDYLSTQVHRTHTSHPSHTSGPPTSHSAPAVAQAALQHTPSSQRPSPHHRVPLTEREKMLRGEHYLPFTPALTEDREQCAAALRRFNDAIRNGASPEERLRNFKAILSLRPSQEPSPGPGSDSRSSTETSYLPVGSVGPGIHVEAPFHCDYGYNIKIGENVIIGPDCRITDTCPVTIGNHVVFSPNVNLVCTTYPIDPKERRKGRGRALGRNIIIEDDVWIGPNTTILPGCRIGRCTTIAAGSLIHNDVPPFVVVAGNPQTVVRGIYESSQH